MTVIILSNLKPLHWEMFMDTDVCGINPGMPVAQMVAMLLTHWPLGYFKKILEK